MTYALVITIKGFEQIAIVDAVKDTTSLTDRMHSPHRSSNIYRLYTGVCSHYGTNCWTTGRVVSHHELLQRHSSFFGQNFQERGRNYVRGVSLVMIYFGNNTFIYSDSVIWLMLLRVIRMNCMSHIGWYLKRTLHDFFKAIRRNTMSAC